MAHTTAYKRVKAHNLSGISGVSELQVKGGEEDGSAAIEDVVIRVNDGITHGDPTLRRFSITEHGAVRVETTMMDAWDDVEKRRCVQDPLYEIFLGPRDRLDATIAAFRENADGWDPSGDFGDAVDKATQSGSSIIARVTLVLALLCKDIRLDQIGTTPIVIEDGVVVQTNGICPYGFEALRQFVLVQRKGQASLEGVDAYAGDLGCERFFGDMAQAYISNRLLFGTPFPVAVRRNTQ
jgi:hypothetical protein